MEAPKCKLCGQRHYGICVVATKAEPAPGHFGPAPRRAVSRAEVQEPFPAPCPDCAKRAERIAALEAELVAIKDNHRAYMREYMKKRRAKKEKPE